MLSTRMVMAERDEFHSVVGAFDRGSFTAPLYCIPCQSSENLKESRARLKSVADVNKFICCCSYLEWHFAIFTNILAKWYEKTSRLQTSFSSVDVKCKELLLLLWNVLPETSKYVIPIATHQRKKYCWINISMRLIASLL